MTSGSEKIENMLAQKRIKLHFFEPSQRTIWTVVGFGKEHWVDPDSQYCSCPGFHFAYLNNKKGCYHLDSLRFALRENKFEKISFSDDEYAGFISSLISDIYN